MIHKKSILLALLSGMLLLGMHAGCHKGAGYDRRLTTADSIMVTNPDSALSLLMSIDGQSLATPGDRAYHSLLLTQARYRCYVVATSDSAINAALDYYSHHRDEQEKLTRCYIYKGAVMEELGQAEEAMSYYQQAKSVAAPNDYFNQGYARLRIGKIYQDNLVADSSDVMQLKEALHYFKLVPDSFYILTSYHSIGSSYIKQNKDSALYYLHMADELAQRLHETRIWETNSRVIAEVIMFNDNARDVQAAKEIAMKLLSHPDLEPEEREHAIMIAAYTLAKQHKADSARYYLAQVPAKGSSPGRHMFYHQCLAQIAVSEGNVQEYAHHFEEADNIADSVFDNDMQRRLRDVEAQYNNESLKYENLHYKTILIASLLGALLALSALALVLMMISRKAARRKRQLQDSEDALERLHSDTVQLASQLAANQAMSENLKQTIRSQLETLTSLVEMHRAEFTHHPRQFSDLFKHSYRAKHPQQSFWSGLRTYADSTCCNIITETVKAFPTLSENDIHFLSLCCCDLPTTVIMACMGYNDAHSVYNKKRRMAEALELPNGLNEYIESYKSRSSIKL